MHGLAACLGVPQLRRLSGPHALERNKVGGRGPHVVPNASLALHRPEMAKELKGFKVQLADSLKDLASNVNTSIAVR